MLLVEACSHEQGVVGAFLETDGDLLFGYSDVRRGIDEIAEDVLGFGGGVEPLPICSPSRR